MTVETAPILTLPQVAQMAQGDLQVAAVPREPSAREAFLRSGISGVSIDTRTLEPGDLFVPLAGAHADGHTFLEAAFARGAAAALCARTQAPAWSGREPGPLVVVDDVTAGLQRLARRFREAWPGALMGVTGSAGKTTTKDLVARVLATAAPTLKTEGNLNNHWGVPLTLMRLRPEHRAAVVEMGMSQPGEIAALAAIAQPNAAVVTNVGHAHLEAFGTLEAIAREKAALVHALRPQDVAFVHADSEALEPALAGARCRLVRFGRSARADVRPDAIEDLGPRGVRLTVAGFPPFTLPLVGLHQASNALAALAVAREFGLDPAAVSAALASAPAPKGRMEVRTVRGATLLVDCYNANPDSTRAALETLAAWPRATRRIAILGDMLELGERAAVLHRETAAAVRDAELWAVGRHAGDWIAGAHGLAVPSRRFEDAPDVARPLREVLGDGVVVLLKASRGARLERALEGLQGEGA